MLFYAPRSDALFSNYFEDLFIIIGNVSNCYYRYCYLVVCYMKLPVDVSEYTDMLFGTVKQPATEKLYNEDCAVY